jgi:hypothetical protein
LSHTLSASTIFFFPVRFCEGGIDIPANSALTLTKVIVREPALGAIMSQFTKALIVSPLSDRGAWVLIEPFSYDVGELGSSNTVEAPKGFKTDFTSIPRPCWTISPRWGKYGSAAEIHDRIYWE